MLHRGEESFRNIARSFALRAGLRMTNYCEGQPLFYLLFKGFFRIITKDYLYQNYELNPRTKLD